MNIVSIFVVQRSAMELVGLKINIMQGILDSNSSQLVADRMDWYLSVEHHEKLRLIISEQEMIYVKTFGLKPFKDGDNWCVLLGDDIQSGVSGFGETPLKAILDFNNNFTISK